MDCPACGGKTRVVDSWGRNKQVLRKRKCVKCGETFETRERRTVHEAHESRWSKGQA